MDPSKFRDPVCGGALDPDLVRRASIFEGREYFFCSEACQEKFLEHPEAYVPRV